MTTNRTTASVYAATTHRFCNHVSNQQSPHASRTIRLTVYIVPSTRVGTHSLTTQEPVVARRERECTHVTSAMASVGLTGRRAVRGALCLLVTVVLCVAVYGQYRVVTRLQQPAAGASTSQRRAAAAAAAAASAAAARAADLAAPPDADDEAPARPVVRPEPVRRADENPWDGVPVVENPWEEDAAAAAAAAPTPKPTPTPPARVRRPATRDPPVVETPPPVPPPPPPAAAPAAVDSSSITAFLRTGGQLPVLLVTKDRASKLQEALTSLFRARGMRPERIYAVQDGDHAGTAGVLREFGVRYTQRPAHESMRGGLPIDGGSRIAQHYGYAFKHFFREADTSSPAVIVIEDDFIFSPDFLEYFEAVAPLLESDPSLWLVSAWNDNGFDDIVSGGDGLICYMRACLFFVWDVCGLRARAWCCACAYRGSLSVMGGPRGRAQVRSPHALQRTRYFPGLGWLLPRALFLGELEATWPTEHWDHWMRSAERHRGRDVLHPEMPRDFHNGVKGTFMDADTHNRYFARIRYNVDAAFSWGSPEVRVGGGGCAPCGVRWAGASTHARCASVRCAAGTSKHCVDDAGAVRGANQPRD
jgi:hypothetical protein